MKQRKLISVLLAVCCFTVLIAANVCADLNPSQEELFKDVSGEIVCTCGCGNQLLSECVCGRATQWKNELRLHIKAGKNKEQLLKLMANKYGPEVLGAPPKEGLNWVLWVVVPYILPVVSAFILWWFLRKWVGQRKLPQTIEQEQGGAEEATPEDEEYKKRLEDELKDFDD